MLKLICFVSLESGKKTYAISKSYKDKNEDWQQNQIYITYAEYVALKQCELFEVKTITY